MLNREHPSSKRTQLTLCMCRFASVTVNLGPTFLSGALAANAGAVMDEPSCPLVQVISTSILSESNYGYQYSKGDIFIYNANMMHAPGSLQTLCPQRDLDLHQQPEHPPHHLPPPQTLQRLHKVTPAGHRWMLIKMYLYFVLN